MKREISIEDEKGRKYLPMSIKSKILLRIVIILALIIIALVVGYRKFNPLYLQINNRNEMMDTREYIITGETNAPVIYIE